MKWRLRSFDQPLPGAYPYAQYGPDGKAQHFPPEPLPEAQARIVLRYRIGNGLPRASYAECLEDVSTYQCFRLKNNPKFCIECTTTGLDNVPLAFNAPGLAPCKGCGVPVETA
jgi:hypothetical protein